MIKVEQSGLHSQGAAIYNLLFRWLELHVLGSDSESWGLKQRCIPHTGESAQLKSRGLGLWYVRWQLGTKPANFNWAGGVSLGNTPVPEETRCLGSLSNF